MKNRLVIFFHYDPNGQADNACLLLLRAIAGQAQRVLFVTNGTLTPPARAAVAATGAELRERPNTGFDVGAYRETLLAFGRTGLEAYGEVVLMNYPLAGPVCPLGEMFGKMEARPTLDFWGLTRHYAMKSRRFRTQYGQVPEHIQSHFLALRPRLFLAEDFWAYWQGMALPASYEESVARHEARFTRWFAERGYRWDTYVDTKDLAGVFVNPLMACPTELLAHRACPLFKRRSCFTPYADELCRTAGESAGVLYRYLKAETDYPVDALVGDLLATQPLTLLAKNLHWVLPLPAALPAAEAGQSIPVWQLEAAGALPGPLAGPLPQGLVCLYRPTAATTATGWYAARAAAWLTAPATLGAVAQCFANDPQLGLVSPALPSF
ncbi:MAG: rhamnan synthesis F family protein, partial [Gemmiger sp.]|nr:rhamnan synthesis F family protein [Gemmiger sp.]